MLHVIVGAGPVGTATANLLADHGEQVRVITRRGTGPDRAEVERVAADATSLERLKGSAEWDERGRKRRGGPRATRG